MASSQVQPPQQPANASQLPRQSMNVNEPPRHSVYDNETQRQTLLAHGLLGTSFHPNQPTQSFYKSMKDDAPRSSMSNSSVTENIALILTSAFGAAGFITFIAGTGLLTSLVDRYLGRNVSTPIDLVIPILAELWFHSIFYLVTFCIALYLPLSKTQSDFKLVVYCFLAISFVFATYDAKQCIFILAYLAFPSSRPSDAQLEAREALTVTIAGIILNAIAFLAMILLLGRKK